MAFDGISAAFTTIELVGLCHRSYHILKKYAEDVQGARDSLKEALNQLRLNQGLFRLLGEVLADVNGTGYEELIDILALPLQKQKTKLGELEELLTKATWKKEDHGLWRRIKWVHQKEDVDEMMRYLCEQEKEVRRFIDLVNT